MQVHGRVEVEFNAGAGRVFLAGDKIGVWNNQVDPTDPGPHGRSHLGCQLLIGVVHLVGHIDGIPTCGNIGISP